jgi:hypothetical protein
MSESSLDGWVLFAKWFSLALEYANHPLRDDSEKDKTGRPGAIYA